MGSISDQKAQAAVPTLQKRRGAVSEPDPCNAPEFVERLRAQDSTAQGQLVQAYAPFLRPIALRYTKDVSAVDDILQDAFVNGLTKIHQFSGEAPLRAWFRRIVINVALMRLRSESRRAEELVDPTAGDFDAYGTRMEPHWQSMKTAEEIVSDQDQAALVREIINQLPDQYRIVLMLRDIEEMSTRTVADILDVTEGTVKVRLHRARAALKKRMEPILRGSV